MPILPQSSPASHSPHFWRSKHPLTCSCIILTCLIFLTPLFCQISLGLPFTTSCVTVVSDQQITQGNLLPKNLQDKSYLYIDCYVKEHICQYWIAVIGERKRHLWGLPESLALKFLFIVGSVCVCVYVHAHAHMHMCK